jgi:hypothetical protein
MPEPPSVLRKALLEVALQAETVIERVRVARVELAPAQPAGLHLHPCPVVGWVSDGVIRFQVADGPVMTFKPVTRCMSRRTSRSPTSTTRRRPSLRSSSLATSSRRARTV